MEEKQVKTKHEFLYKGKKKTTFTIHYEWKFTEDEKEYFERELQKTSAPPERIERFISHLEFYCQGMKLIQTPKQREAKINRKQGLRVYKEALQWTKKIMRGTRGLISLTRIPDHKDSRSIEEYKFLNRYIRWALELNAPLQRMIQTFEDHSKQKNHIGRKEADYTGFISRIAKIYQEYIGKPTKHKYGPFSLRGSNGHGKFRFTIQRPGKSNFERHR